jgi:hypothetical protein
MERALAGQTAGALPDPGPVCARPGQQVNQDGGRSAGAPITPDAPESPTVQQLPTSPNGGGPPAPTAKPQTTTATIPPITVPTNCGPGNGNGRCR